MAYLRVECPAVPGGCPCIALAAVQKVPLIKGDDPVPEGYEGRISPTRLKQAWADGLVLKADVQKALLRLRRHWKKCHKRHQVPDALVFERDRCARALTIVRHYQLYYLLKIITKGPP